MKTVRVPSILSKQMNRKEFIIHMGLMLITLTGIARVLQTLTIDTPNNTSHSHSNNKQQNTQGYGTSAYGV